MKQLQSIALDRPLSFVSFSYEFVQQLFIALSAVNGPKAIELDDEKNVHAAQRHFLRSSFP